MLNNGNVTWKKEPIGPNEARRILEHNTHNRAIVKRRVALYADDMRAGRWVFTHQGIGIASDGTVIDGQHRLLAIIESGLTLPFLVARGLDIETQQVIDDHKPRGIADALTLTGRFGSLNTRYVAMARVFIDRGFVGYQATGISKSRLGEAICEHRKVFDFTDRTIPKGSRPAPAPFLGAFARSCYHIPEDRLRRFAEVFISGLSEEPEEFPIVLLRNWFMSTPGANKSGNASNRLSAYRKSEQALAAFAKRTPFRKLTEAKSELFLLPGETD